MRNFLRFLLIGCLVAFPVAAQRGGGSHGGGSHGGSSFHGGGGFRSGGFSGGYRSGGFGGFHGGGFRGGYGGFNHGYGRSRFFFGAGFGIYPYGYPFYGSYDWGYPYYGYSYGPYSYYDYYGYPSSYYNYSYAPAQSYYNYGSSPAPVVVTYDYGTDPAPPPARVYEPTARPRSYARDNAEAAHQNGERPIYLIAFKGQDNIRAAEAYWVTGSTLHFVTLQHEQRQAPLDSVDHALTLRLNRERHVDFRLPATDR